MGNNGHNWIVVATERRDEREVAMDGKHGGFDEGDRLTALGGGRPDGHAGQLSAGARTRPVWRSPVITRIGLEQTLALHGSVRDGLTGSA